MPTGQLCETISHVKMFLFDNVFQTSVAKWSKSLMCNEGEVEPANDFEAAAAAAIEAAVGKLFSLDLLQFL